MKNHVKLTGPIDVDKGVYAWDGHLLSNTPVRKVIAASPRNDKHIFIVENYTRIIDRLPSNMVEVLDRAKDIVFSDNTKHNIKMAKLVTRQIQLIERLYDFYILLNIVLPVKRFF